MNNCNEALDSVPNTVIAHVRAEGGEAYAFSVVGNTWKWCGVTVPILRDFWSAHVLVTSMVFYCGSMVVGTLWGCVFLLGAKTLCYEDGCVGSE